jgi:HD domain
MTEDKPTAEDLARELLAGLPERVAHTEGVARKAEEVASVFEPDEAADLVAAAWLHDIGYAQWLVGEGMHALDGGWFLQEQKFPERVCQLVAHHSGARFEARERGLLDRLEYSFPKPDPALLDALTYADMTTSPRGLPVSFDERIAEIIRRYPPDDPVHRAILAGRSDLAKSVEDTLARLRRHAAASAQSDVA